MEAHRGLDDLDILDARIVASNDIDRSVLYQRTARRDIDGMPPLGSNVLDATGLQVLRAWIESDYCDGIVPAETQCNDGIDNDNNGQADCADPNCANAAECAPLTCNNPVTIDTVPASISGSMRASMWT